ncbi:MAG: AsmA family protein [Bryobacteraceae bacterium]
MKRILLVAGIVVVLILAAVVCLPFLIDANRFRPMLENQLSTALGRDVRVGDLKLSIWSGGVTADDLSVADDPAYSRRPFVTTKSLALGVDLPALILSRKLHVLSLAIERPEIMLIQSPAGDWNFSSLGGKSAAAPKRRDATPQQGPGFDLSVKLVTITAGRLSLGELHGSSRTKTLEKVNVKVENFSSNAAFPFNLSGVFGGGGEINVNGTAGPINPADAAQTPVRLKVKVSQFDLGAAGVDSSGGLAGLLALDGSGSSNGRSLHLSGQVKVEKLRLVKTGSAANEPVQFDFNVDHDLRKRSGILHAGKIHVGQALATLTGTYAQHGDSTVLNMDLSGPDMPVPQLTAMLPAMGVVLPAGASLDGGSASAKLSFDGPIGGLVTSGSLGLANTRLRGFDLGSKMSTIERLAGMKTGPNTEIQNLAANVRVAPDGSNLQDIKLVVPAIGELGGNGTISPAQALDFKMSATLHAGGAMSMLGVGGNATVPFLVGGTMSQPVFRPDLKGMAAGEIKNLTHGDIGKTAGSILGGLLGKKPKQ